MERVIVPGNGLGTTGVSNERGRHYGAMGQKEDCLLVGRNERDLRFREQLLNFSADLFNPHALSCNVHPGRRGLEESHRHFSPRYKISKHYTKTSIISHCYECSVLIFLLNTSYIQPMEIKSDSYNKNTPKFCGS